MTTQTLVADLWACGIVVIEAGDSIGQDASTGVLTDDVVILRESKRDIIRLLRLWEELPVDGEMAELLAMDEVDPVDIP